MKLAQQVPDEVMQEVNIFRQYWESIDWTGVLSTIVQALIQIIAAIILFIIVKKLGNYLINLTFKRKMNKDATNIPNRQQTLHQLSINVFNAITYFFLLFAILEIIGIPVGSLIAGAGVIGLALSLGAQDFVSDIVNGIMILMEKQIDVGDSVDIEGITGNVIDVNLKTTKVKDFDGTIHYIPNREIAIISNKSRTNMRAQIHIRLYADTDLQKVRSVLNETSEKYVSNDELVVEEPDIIYVPMSNGQLAAQITMYTQPDEQYGVQMKYYELYVEALNKADISLPSNTLDLNPA